MAEQERLTPEEFGRRAAAETLAMMDQRRDEAAKVGIDLPALLAADFTARPPPLLTPAAATLFGRVASEATTRSGPRLVYSRD